MVSALVTAAAFACALVSSAGESAPAPGEIGAPGIALLARKILCVPFEGEQVIDDGAVLVRDGRIVAVSPVADVQIESGFVIEDLGDRWLSPGLIDLHSHCGGGRHAWNPYGSDFNDPVHLVNGGLRMSSATIPANPRLMDAVAGGVTAILYLPGSSTNIGGEGVLVKTGLERYEDALIRDPGALKLAQSGNPEGWAAWSPGRALQNWNTRTNLERGVAYARAWQDHDEHGGKRPERRLDLDVFRDLARKDTQIAVHTQIYQVVLTTLTMLRRDFGFDVYLDHGELGGYRLATLAKELGVPAIVGPRQIEPQWGPMIAFVQNDPDGVRGTVGEFQKSGHPMLGFNTDSVYPEYPHYPGDPGGPWAQDLALQAAMGMRYGADDSALLSMRGVTIVPAKAAGIDERVGSLEVGKDADLVIWDGNPIDPRTTVEAVIIEGVRVYDVKRDERRW